MLHPSTVRGRFCHGHVLEIMRMRPGVNGAGKTTQLQIITGELEPDTGEVIKARPSMRIAYLTQEFDVNPGRTVREEFLSAYDEQIKVRPLALLGC